MVSRANLASVALPAITKACIHSFLKRTKKYLVGQLIAPRRSYPHSLKGGQVGGMERKVTDTFAG